MRHTRQAGFTIVEFMIASAATMVMLGAAFTLLNSMFTANAGMMEIAATQQSVRVALNTIARDITMAGTGLPTSGVAVPTGANSTVITRPGMAAVGSPQSDLATPNGIIPIISPGDAIGPTLFNYVTDALTIFSIDQESPVWNVNTIAVFPNRFEVDFTVPVDMGSMQLFPGDLLLFNNANGAVLACVTDLHPTMNTLAFFRTPDAMGINQPAAQFGNLYSLSDMATPPAFPPTTATRVNVINYVINNANPAHPTLERTVNAQQTQAIAEDIENLQFSFDLFDFTLGTAQNNQPFTATPNQIRSVEVAINGRSPKKLARTNDYWRFQLVSKVNVRNATFRNRY